MYSTEIYSKSITQCLCRKLSKKASIRSVPIFSLFCSNITTTTHLDLSCSLLGQKVCNYFSPLFLNKASPSEVLVPLSPQILPKNLTPPKLNQPKLRIWKTEHTSTFWAFSHHCHKTLYFNTVNNQYSLHFKLWTCTWSCTWSLVMVMDMFIHPHNPHNPHNVYINEDNVRMSRNILKCLMDARKK